MNFSDYGSLVFERRSRGVLLITINRPDRYNATDEQLHHDLVNVWRDVQEDKETRVAVITGAGKAFCAGGDTDKQRRTLGDYQSIVETLEGARDLVSNILNCDKPIVSAINGVAVGAGLAIALLADVSVIGDSVKITDGHLRIGVAAGDHAAMIWPLLCGMAKAKYYLLTAEFIDGVEAERIGLVSKSVPTAQVLDEALSIADKLALSAEEAVRWTKRSLNHWLRQAQPIFEASLAYEMIAFFGDDIREGLAAISEKRLPSFQPRFRMTNGGRP